MTQRPHVAKRQSRRSISVAGLTYQRAYDYCRSKGRSVSGFLEELIKERLDAEGAPEPTARPLSAEDIASQHFTF